VAHQHFFEVASLSIPESCLVPRIADRGDCPFVRREGSGVTSTLFPEGERAGRMTKIVGEGLVEALAVDTFVGHEQDTIQLPLQESLEVIEHSSASIIQNGFVGVNRDGTCQIGHGLKQISLIWGLSINHHPLCHALE
jgi:hypothetical protein